MGKLLTNKREIMKYLGVGERVIDVLFTYKLPHFRIGQRIMSNTDAIDQWSLELSMNYFTIKNDDMETE